MIRATLRCQLPWRKFLRLALHPARLPPAFLPTGTPHFCMPSICCRLACPIEPGAVATRRNTRAHRLRRYGDILGHPRAELREDDAMDDQEEGNQHGRDQRPGERINRAAANARGMAKIPVMMSPHPADCGNGPPSLPAAASTRKNAPKMRMALRPTSTGIGIASSDARTAGEKLARATTVAIGVTNKIGMAAGFASPPAPATEAAKPIHVPATAANVRRWASSVGGGAVTATRQTAIAAVVATVPIRSNTAGSLHA